MKNFTLSFSIAFIALVFTAISYSQTIPFEDDFEAYTVGGQLACQNPNEWTTYSHIPCDPDEDAYIRDNYAYSGTNSAAIVNNTDLIKPFGTLTSGKWDILFRIYIPSGKEASYFCKSDFRPTVDNNAMAVWFKHDGTARLNVTPTTSTSFNYTQDEWLLVKTTVDLDNDKAEFWCEGDSISSWRWTIEGDPLQLVCVNFYGLNFLYEMYVDNFVFGSHPITSVENEEIPTEYALDQNYPNPFNPSTTIKYALRERSLVELKIYDAIGREVIVMVNEEQSAGSYEFEFNATSLPSGTYFYKLQAGEFIETKKMVLMK